MRTESQEPGDEVATVVFAICSVSCTAIAQHVLVENAGVRRFADSGGLARPQGRQQHAAQDVARAFVGANAGGAALEEQTRRGAVARPGRGRPIL